MREGKSSKVHRRSHTKTGLKAMAKRSVASGSLSFSIWRRFRLKLIYARRERRAGGHGGVPFDNETLRSCIGHSSSIELV